MSKRKPKLGSIYQRGEIYWIKYYRNGQCFRESSHSDSYTEAERLLKRRNGEIVTGRFAGLAPERVRLRDLFDDLVEDYRMNGLASLVQLESRLKKHLRPEFDDLRAAELSSNHIKRYQTRRRADGAANATINRELETVVRAFRLASKCDPPKVGRVVHVPMLREDNVRTNFLDDQGYLRLRQELPEYLKPLLVVGYHVGCRLGELKRLKWPQVDLDQGLITLLPGSTKNKKGRKLPIYGEMPQWLVMGKQIRDTRFPACQYVFFRDGQPIGDFRKAWHAACDRAKLGALLFHDLRRSAVRNMRLAGIPENVAMELSGHKTRSVFDRYNIVSPRDLIDAGQRLQERLNKSLGTITGTVEGDRTQNATNISGPKLLN
jgi:integrase